jgi:hypothetical protein
MRFLEALAWSCQFSIRVEIADIQQAERVIRYVAGARPFYDVPF